eukprot:7229430-Alexandrium_andersonii.AAC.1
MHEQKTADAGSTGFSGKPDGPPASRSRVSSTSPNARSNGRLIDTENAADRYVAEAGDLGHPA